MIFETGEAAVLFAQGQSNAALLTFVVYILAVFGLAAMSNRLLKSKNFLSEYFLGSRSLGVWAFALTFAATSASGGSFTGFPSKIYTHGWVLALWIGSYMVVPLVTMALLGKRINQVARISEAITVPDVLRDRLHSTAIGLVAVTLIVFFMSFNLVAQFKAGSLILKTLLDDVGMFHQTAVVLGGWTSGVEMFSAVDPEYLLCLFTFGIAVIVYTTYGGFHAVVWTDVMQGIVMVVGVLIMLPLALYAVGGMENATRQMAEMTPPNKGTVTLALDGVPTEDRHVRSGTWLTLETDGAPLPKLYRTSKPATFKAGTQSLEGVEAIELTTAADIEKVLKDLADKQRESNIRVAHADMNPYEYGSKPEQAGSFVTAPGPSAKGVDGFLPLSLSISFFFMWAISGSGQPSSMVRLMAFNSSKTLTRSIFTVALYYSAIYFPLVMIFCCARVLMPGMEAESDRIMPAMAVFLTENVGIGWLAGLLVAAPFAAVMSTVDSFLLMISSALVRDIYQRNINPQAQEKTVKLLSYFFTFLVGTGAMLGAVNPATFLQDIIVYTGSGLASCFLAPMVFALYWPRANRQGCLAGMLAGYGAHLSMYVAGHFANGSFFEPYRLMDFDPIIIGLFVSFATVYIVTRITPPPPEELVRKYFYKRSR